SRGRSNSSRVLLTSMSFPKYIKAVVSDTRAACCMLCVTTTNVKSFFRSKIRSSIFAVAMGSRAEHGSSIRRTSGLTASALAMQSRCCWPPERLAPLSSRESFTSSHKAACFRLPRTALSIMISCMASFSPYQAESDSTLSLIAIAHSSRNGSEPDDDARYDAEPEHHDDEDQGNAPSGLVLRHIRSGGPDINGVRQRLDRLVESPEPVVASKRGDEEGGGFSRNPGNPEEPARYQCAARGRNDDPKDGPVPRDAQGEGRFPHGDGYEAQGLFRGARHERHHD